MTRMDVREKLVEIVKKAAYSSLPSNTEDFHLNMFVTNLLAHGVTVQDVKPLEEFLHPIDAYKGLKAKYLVFKADTGERVGNCFVLRPDKDHAAVEAIRAYARATDNETLAEDIYNWVGKGEPVQEWISVKDRLPEKGQEVLVFDTRENWTGFAWLRPDETWTALGFDFPLDLGEVTHWMPLPEKPKGE